jgi:hypothetical protein
MFNYLLIYFFYRNIKSYYLCLLDLLLITNNYLFNHHNYANFYCKQKPIYKD